jgi:Protein of unknown function (DUF3089)
MLRTTTLLAPITAFALLGTAALPAIAQQASPPPTVPASTLGAPAMAPAPAERPGPNDYGRPENWLCRPGRLDACTTVDLAVTVVAPDGSTRTEPFTAAAKPGFDCFYVYPTVSAEPTPNSDMLVTAAERNVITQQFARFGAKCRTFAPMYRQVTLAALRTAMAGKPNPGDRELAYADVRDAWRHYLVHDNGGRGVVLIGHSQGTGQLTRLIREEIDGKPVQSRIISAILAGGQVTVAKGKDIGGDFKSMPLCRSADQTGCVVAWNTFRAEIPPPADSRFGRAADPEREVACVNPASLLAGKDAAAGDVELNAQFPAGGNSGGVTRSPPDWTGKGIRIPTTFVSLPGLVRGACATTDGANYLRVTTTPPVEGGRARNFNGDIMIGPAVLKSWGLHMVDVNIVEGDLTTLVERQGKAWLAAH